MVPLAVFSIVVAIIVAVALTYAGRAWWGWSLGWVFPLAVWWAAGGTWGLTLAIVLWLGVAIVTGIPGIRRRLLVGPLMRRLAPSFPRMSETERIALEAGTVWWGAELFSGAPDFERIIRFAPKQLSDKEHEFLDGPCTQLCRMLDDYAIRKDGDLAPHVWSFIKRERFMGMIIPEEYGGLGFSALAHSSVITMLASRSAAACVTVMVPNSLGPAELLLRYGTEEQKQYYLPRLAIGDEIPCFALTEPHAGSDAAAIRSRGIVCWGSHDGRQVLGIRLTWDKRYITLAPVATVLGLAFRLFDPDHLLGTMTDLGITCALVPVHTPGVWIGARHDPLSSAFQNGPTRGTDVFVPLDQIIGGPQMAGQGWRMLMECLSAGRSLSLPADAVGAAQVATRVVGAYASVREQFGRPIGQFEGVEAPLGRIAGTMYWMNAVRVITAGAVDAGERPGVVSAIAKRWSTEALRRVANDAMDVAGGAAICKGRHNLLAPIYETVPIGITVEGANILTRSLIVFGQGAIRCHPYALAELRAAEARDVDAFDRAISGHVNFLLRNVVRSVLLSITGGAIARAPDCGRARRPLRKLTRLSASFAVTADIAMITLGAALKRAENISGRMADALAWMYITFATVNRYVATRVPDDDALFDWATAEALCQTERALHGVIENLPNRLAAGILRLVAFPFGSRLRSPSDRTTTAAAHSLLEGASGRLRLTTDIYVPSAREVGLGQLEYALELAVIARPVRAKVRRALHTGVLSDDSESQVLDQAVAKGILTSQERALVIKAGAARDDVIEVDVFSPLAFHRELEPPFGAASPPVTQPTERRASRSHSERTR
ncbi:MAG TPA: acyl-CoA dehydrogenase [Kofleriaceae bacterium]|nr:acyl-CoA dehydrogenase [Kofleriaceae bacterium]